MNTRHLFITILALGSLTACQDVVGTGDELTADEVNKIADDMIGTSFDATGQIAAANVSDTNEGIALYQDPITSHTEFTITRSCLLGGQVVLEGTHDRVWDWADHSGTSDLHLTKTHEDCTRPLRGRDITVTLNGADNVVVDAHHEWADGHRSGLQTLSLEGAVAWETSDDRSGTCQIDLDVTFDPETHTRTATGQICNRTIDATTSWTNQDG